MEKYNKVYFTLWLLFSAATLSLTLVLVVNELGEVLDNVAISFILLLFASEVIGFILASSVIDRIPWAYYTHAFFTSMNRRTILYQSF